MNRSASASPMPDVPPTRRLLALLQKLHALKRARVIQDPELYKGFDRAADQHKPFVVRHVETLYRQVTGLVAEAMAEGEIRPGEPATVTKLLLNATLAYHHPKLVAERIHQREAKPLQEVVKVLLAGLRP